MLQRQQLFSLALVALVGVGCEPPAVEPELTVTVSPKTLDGEGQTATIKVLATDTKGQPGTGTVRVTSTAGTAKNGVEINLLAGEGTAEFGCARSMDATCNGIVRLTAEWVSAGKPASATTSLTVSPPVVRVPDAGTTLTSSAARLTIGFRQSAELVATYSVDGVPTPDASVTLTSTLGVLSLADGGAFSSPATTDSAGQVRALLTDDGVAGMATVTAAGPIGRSGSTSVTIYKPDASVTMDITPAVLTMGFNETATVRISHRLDGSPVTTGYQLAVQATPSGLVRFPDGGAIVSPITTNASGDYEFQLTDMNVAGSAIITATDTVFNKSVSRTLDVRTPDAGVFVTAQKPRIYIGVNDSTNITARMITNGQPSVGRDLTVATSLGTLSLPDGGAWSGLGQTGASGTIDLVLTDTGTSGTATVTATDPMSMRSGTAPVEILNIGTITYTSMTCAGSPCTLMGIRSSGYQTQAALRFTVRDARAMPQPVPGVRVTFTLNNAPTGTQVTTSGVTDSQGNVDAVVTSGDSIGSFTVTATVYPGIAVTSPTVGVRGAKPASRGFQFQCARVNLAAYVAPTPPLSISDVCSFILVDRNSNPVGTGTTVQFLAEAGSIPNSAAAAAYNPTMSANEGRGSVTFSTNGAFPAADVSPFAALPSQFPFPRIDERQRMDGSLIRNPRDGLVTIVAYTDGEEWFTDSNSNGVRDANEQFIDQGEPLVDVNDDDVWNPGENYIDVDGNGAWTGPNGQWDSSTKIWTKTFVLYTGVGSISSLVPSGFALNTGGMTSIDVFMGDLNLNRLEAGTVASVSRTGSMAGMASLANTSGLALDDYGFQVEPRRLTNASGTGDCLPAETVCVYRTAFGTWSNLFVGTINLTVPTPMNNDGGVTPGAVSFEATTRGVKATATVNGVFPP
ncbi:MAG: Ig-like domain-containing protein [Myxococcota bacterium]